MHDSLRQQYQLSHMDWLNVSLTSSVNFFPVIDASNLLNLLHRIKVENEALCILNYLLNSYWKTRMVQNGNTFCSIYLHLFYGILEMAFAPKVRGHSIHSHSTVKCGNSKNYNIVTVWQFACIVVSLLCQFIHFFFTTNALFNIK